MSKIQESFDKTTKALDEAKAFIEAEHALQKEEIKKQRKVISSQVKANITRSKKLKAGEEQLAKDKASIAAKIKLVRKDEELSEAISETNKDMAVIVELRKELTIREHAVTGQLEEIEAREKKLNKREKNYKKELEQKIVKKFMTE